MVNDSRVVELISNKFKTYELLRKNKIRIPEYYLSKNMKSLEKNIKKFKEKKNNFVIKPLNSRGGRGIIICSYNATNTNKYKPKRIKLVNYNNPLSNVNGVLNAINIETDQKSNSLAKLSLLVEYDIPKLSVVDQKINLVLYIAG